jgi:Tfp pilus assembly protein PilW
MKRVDQGGFTLIEAVIGLGLLIVILSAAMSLVVQNSKVNTGQQMRVDIQSTARNCLDLVVMSLRSAGWDPRNVGVPSMTISGTTSNTVEVFADIDSDGDTDGTGEDVTIRFNNGQIEWKRLASAATYDTLGVNITNDSNGDGTAEPMFTVDSSSNPSWITAQITARSPVPDPQTGQYLRYTVSSEVILRKTIWAALP